MGFVKENEAKTNDAWFLDSRCSNHMCGDKGMILNIKHGYKHSFKYGNNSQMFVVGKDSVRLMFNDTTFLIPNLQYYHPCKGLTTHTNMTTNHIFILLNKSSNITLPIKECLHASYDLIYLLHQSKQHCNSIPKKSEWHASKVLELIHTKFVNHYNQT
ncbi:hypothetical protein CR513_37412, partial [Mucuna pruriens]